MKPEINDVNRPFWDGLRSRRLVLQVDQATGRMQFYPRPLGVYGEKGVAWTQASGRGTLFALTLSRVGPPVLQSLVPYALALVKLEEGPRMLVRIAAPYERLAIGQALEIDWDSTGEGFPVFKPIPGDR